MHLNRPITFLATAALALAGITACSPAQSEPSPPEDSPSTAAPEGSSPSVEAPEAIRFALDWSLNTNHIGLVVAEELGYFAEAGIDVEILPIAPTTPIEQITAGEADFGISEQTGIQISRTQGHEVTSVFQVVQRETGVVIYDANRSDISRPADLDGLTYGGFGDPIWGAVARAVITGDGGQGEFEEVVLNSDVYTSLDSGEVDFTLSVVSWENITAEMEGRPYGTFRYQDFGVPENHTINIVGADTFIAEHPQLTEGFVQAVQRGYEYTVNDPQKAADLLIEAYPDLFADETELVHASTELLATEYFVAEGVTIGAAQPQYWEEYGDFLLQQGMLTDPSGAVLDVAPDWNSYYTNEFLSR